MSPPPIAVKLLGAGLGSALRHFSPTTPGRSSLAQVWHRHFAWRGDRIPGRTSFGAKMLLKPCDSIQGRILTTGVWEPVISKVISDSLSAGDVFIDVGANVGYYTLMAAMKTGSAGVVYAIEASPSVFADLSTNVDLNGLKNVTVLNVAVSDAPGELPIFLAGDANVGHSTIIQDLASHDGHKQEAIIRADVLQSLVPLDVLLKARLIKIDIEGAERMAIQGLAPTLSKFSARTEWLMELSPEFSPGGQSDVDWIFAQFAENGYSCYVIPNDYGQADDSGMVKRGLQRCTEAPTGRLSDVLFTRAR